MFELFFLLILLLFLMFLTYASFNKDFFSPSFLICALFFVSCLFAILGNFKWEVEVNMLAIIAIVLGILCIFIGESLARKVYIRNEAININKPVGVKIRKNTLFFVIVFEAILLVLYYRRMLEIATSIGYTGINLIQFIRVATVNESIKVGTTFTVLLGVFGATSYICILAIINSVINKQLKKDLFDNLLLLIPIIFNILVCILSGARSGIIKLFVVSLMMLFCKFKDRAQKINMIKILLISAISVFVLLFVFTRMGMLTKKVNSSNIFDAIYKYVGSSIVALSCWFDKFSSSTYFGQESFWGIRYLLNMIFPNVEAGSPFLESVVFPGGDGSNIYTGFRAYIADFGWFGLIIICIILGYVYGYFYKKMIRKPSPLIIILYSFFFYEFFNLLFAPSVTSDLFTSSQIFGVMWIIVINYLLLGKTCIKPLYETRL